MRELIKEFLGVYTITLMSAGFLLCAIGAGGNFDHWSQRLKRRFKKRAIKITNASHTTAQISYLKQVEKQGYLQRDWQNRDIDRGQVIRMMQRQRTATAA